MFFNLCQLIGGLILTVGNLPQIIQILRTRSVNDLNLNTFAMIFAGVLLMEVYAVNLALSGVGLMFLITNSLSLVFSFINLALILIYRKRPEVQHAK